MINEQLVHVIENNADVLAEHWTREVRSSRFTPTYRRFTDEELKERSRRVYENLGNWLDLDTGSSEIGREYTLLGKTRYLERFPLSEVLYGLHITKKVVWRHIMSSGVLSSALEIYRAMDLIVRLFHFYDLAGFFIARGYQDALFQKVKNAADHGLTKNLEDIFRREGKEDPECRERNAVIRGWIESWNLFKTR